MRCVIALAVSAFLPVAAGAADGPTFEVASVKIAGPETPSSDKVTGGPGTGDPGRFHAPHIAMFALLTRAFGVDPDQIKGPGWLTSMGQPLYDIDAIMPAHATTEQFQRMLQNLLIERFHLVFRRETRNFPGYELVVDKGGPKIKEVTSESNSEEFDPKAAARAPKGDDSFPAVHGSFTMMMVKPALGPGRERTKYSEQSMAELAKDLGRLIAAAKGLGPLDSHPRVLDKTGMPGKYTFVLACLNPYAALSAGAGASSALSASDPADADDVFAAVRKQLGLRIDKTADVPGDVIIVESVDKTPTEN